MEVVDVVLLIAAGLGAGFVAGLVGVGGGVIFAPVLLFYYQGIGIAGEVVAQLTVGTSLLCTFVASLASTRFHLKKEAVDTRIAWRVGLLSAVAIFLMTRFVTTQPWYDARTFQIVFSLLLIVVVARMVLATPAAPGGDPDDVRDGTLRLGLVGSVAGAVAAAAGVGGGVVLVPAYSTVVCLPMRRTVGTSSATIVLIAAFGVLTYLVSGLGREALPASAVGYVDLRGLFLAVPALFGARVGAFAAHRVRTRVLRLAFAALALFISARLLYDALVG